MSDEPPNVSFRCFIPDLNSALKFGGDSARITIEVPACDVLKAVEMIAFKGVPLVVRFEEDSEPEPCLTGPEQGSNNGTKSNNIRARKVRQSVWTSPETTGIDDAA